MSSSPETPPSRPDPWTVWFSRFLQVTGLGAFIEQLVVGQGAPDRPWILLISLAMMIGGLGLQILLRAVLRIGDTS